MKQGSRLNKKTFRIALAVILLGVGLMPGLQATVFAGDGLVLKAIMAEGLPNPWIKGIFHDGDTLVVTTTAGTVKRAPGDEKFVPFAPGPGFKGVNVTGWAEFGGKSWVGTESALNVREGGKWSSLDRFQQVQHAEELLYSDSKALYALARVMYGGVLKFSDGNWSVVDRGSGTGIMNNATAILSRGDELFIGTTTNGLYYFDGKGWKVLSQNDGLPGVWVTSLAATDEGVWVGCYNGLALFDGSRFKSFSKEDGLPGNKISVLKVIKGKLVVGTMQNGLSIRQGRLFVNATMATGLSDDRIETLEADERGVWVGTINGLNLVEVR
jgi:hypothetical protein